MPRSHASAAASVSVAKATNPQRGKVRATPAKPARASETADERATRMLREIRARGERLTADIHGLLARIG